MPKKLSHCVRSAEKIVPAFINATVTFCHPSSAEQTSNDPIMTRIMLPLWSLLSLLLFSPSFATPFVCVILLLLHPDFGISRFLYAPS